MAITVTVNGQVRTLDVDPDTPLLWAIRETLGLTGTKFGCGIAACGACTVHVNGKAERSCSMPVSSVDGATGHHDRRSRRGRRAHRRCSRPGSTSRCRSAATASRA